MKGDWNMGIEQVFVDSLTAAKVAKVEQVQYLLEGLNNLAHFHFTRDEHELACLYCDQALELGGSKLSPESSEMVTSTALKALAQSRQGLDVDENQVHSQVEKALPGMRNDWQGALRLLCYCYCLFVNRGRQQEAEKYHRQALALAKRTFGSRSEEVVNLFVMKGDHLCQHGNLDEAGRCYNKARIMLRGSLPPGSTNEVSITDKLHRVRANVA